MPEPSAVRGAGALSAARTVFFVIVAGNVAWHPLLTAEEIMQPKDFYDAGEVSLEQDGRPLTFRYRLLRPPETSNAERHPLVVYLHGAGERGDDNARQLKYLPTWMIEKEVRQRHPCFLLVPQCRQDERWVDVSWADSKSTPAANEPTTDLAAAILAMEQVLRREPVDPDRVLLTGLSMGGYGAWDLATRMPERFAALLPICGGGDERLAEKLVELPIWAFHGDADTAVPVERSRAMIEAISAAGGSPRYSELPGVGHDAWTTAYRDPEVLDWFFAQRRKGD